MHNNDALYGSRIMMHINVAQKPCTEIRHKTMQHFMENDDAEHAPIKIRQRKPIMTHSSNA